MTEDVTDLTRGVYRRVYSGFITGQRINRISQNAEAWFWRILVTVDDFGNGPADPDMCKTLTAGRRKVSTRQVSSWLREMKQAGLIEFYAAKGETFLHVMGFEDSQPAGKNGKRIKKFPFPDESGCIQVNPELSSASDNHTHNDNQNQDDNDTQKAQAPGSSPFSSEEFLEALTDFEQHRKEIRHKLTPKARQAMYADFEKWGERKSILAIHQAIRNGWRGVFEPKEDNSNGTSTKDNGLRRTTAAERNNEQLKRNLARVEQLRREGSGDPNQVAGGNVPTTNRR